MKRARLSALLLSAAVVAAAPAWSQTLAPVVSQTPNYLPAPLPPPLPSNLPAPLPAQAPTSAPAPTSKAMTSAVPNGPTSAGAGVQPSGLPGQAEKEPDGLTARKETTVAAAVKVGWTAASDVVAELKELREHPDGKGLDVIRLRGVASKGRVTWVEAVRIKDGKAFRRAQLKEPLWSVGYVDAADPNSVPVKASGGVNPMIRVARSLLEDDKDGDKRDGSANGDGGRNAGAGTGGDSRSRGAGGSTGGNGGGAGRLAAASNSPSNTSTSASTLPGGGTGGTAGTGTGNTSTPTTTLPGGVTGGTGGTGTGNTSTPTTTLPGGVTGATGGTGTGNTSTPTTTLPGGVTGGTGGTGTGNTSNPTTTLPGGGTGGIGGTGPGNGSVPTTTLPGSGSGTGTVPVTTTVGAGGATTPIGGSGTVPGGTAGQTGGTGGVGATDPGNATPAPVPQITADSVACPDRIDWAAMQVYSQAQDRTFQDGVMTSITPCSDDLHTFQIKFNATGCSDEVDSSGGWAYDRAKPYYVKASGTYREIGSCQRYDGRQRQISPTEVGCTHDVDVVGGVARIRTRRVYTSSAGVVTEVSGCVASGVTASIQWTIGGCNIRHDIGGGRSYQQARRYYIYSGAEYPVGSCEDYGATFVHSRTDTGCPTVQNDQSHQVTFYRRTVATLPTGVTTIVDCSPDQTFGMTADRSACSGQYSHVPAASVSYGMVRYTYNLYGALQATDCVVDTGTAYPHQDAMGSWVHNDQAFQSRQSIITYIDTPTGRIVVSTRDGPWVPDYTPTANETRPNVAGTTYAGCQRNTPSSVWTTFTRTDGTSVTLQTGAGPVVSTADGCSPLPSLVEVLGEWSESNLSGVDACYNNINKMQKRRTAERRQNGAGEVFQDPWVETTVIVETRVEGPGPCNSGN